MKKALLFLTCLLIPTLNNNAFADEPKGCPMKSDEELVCAVVMCDFGLIMGENSSECKDYRIKFAKYLATLGFWDKPPKCKTRDMSCNKTGNAKKAATPPDMCTDPVTMETDAACVKGKNVYEYDCDDIEAGELQDACYINLAKSTESCDELGGEAKDKCLGIEPEPEVEEPPPETTTTEETETP